MAKKSLGDLLREEAQKNLESQDLEDDTGAQISAEELLEDETQSEQEPLPELTVAASSLAARRSRTTKAELETIVSDLEKALQQSHSKEASLQQQLDHLQAELDEQKTLVNQLQTNLLQTDKIKLELEQAKKVILQLSEANSKVTEKADASKKESSNLSLQKLPPRKSSPRVIQPSLPSTKLSNEDVGWVD